MNRVLINGRSFSDYPSARRISTREWLALGLLVGGIALWLALGFVGLGFVLYEVVQRWR